ncbi:MAG: tripartite tricarboxylate transporter substrate binding protein, partial [Hyphomicrobiaceae bacterium]|nr:tripartite tricarboxylate transporter substrate binding protein [Hyphomicrobiaceae bacterium]
AQEAFPERPIRLIVPFPAGGTVDLVARLLAERIKEERGWSVVIENKAGAGGVIAADATAKAAPDGYTLLLTTPNHTINGALKPKLPYDTERDLVPITIVAQVPELLVSYPGAPFESFASLIAYAKQNPRKLNYSSAGNGTLPHVTMELLLHLASVEIVHVAYRGAAPALIDLVAGVVHIKFDTFATSAELIAAGKLRALAVASKARLPQLPEVPTIAERGFPGYEGVLWMGLVAPAGTPKAAIDKLVEASVSAVRSPALAERLVRDSVEPVGSTPAEFAARITSEMAQWRDLAKSVQVPLQ